MLFIFTLSPTISKAQNTTLPTGPQNCSDLFFSELLFSKVPNANNLMDLDYSLEIYNPTNSTIDMANYTLSITTTSNNTITIPMNGLVAAGDVYVISNNKADMNLQQMSDKLTPDLRFDTGLYLELAKNGTILDKFGDINQSTSAFDPIAFANDPYGYLSTYNINLDDYNNMDIRRGYFIKKGNQNFTSSIFLNEWKFLLNPDRTDIGQHTNGCHSLSSDPEIGYSINEPFQLDCGYNNGIWIDGDINNSPDPSWACKYSIKSTCVASSLTFGNEIVYGNSSGESIQNTYLQSSTFTTDLLYLNPPIVLSGNGSLTLSATFISGASACPTNVNIISGDGVRDFNYNDCLDTGIKDPTFKNITLFPNPALNIIKINDISNISIVEILDIVGKVVFKNNNVVSNIINIEYLENGNYFVKIKFNNGNFITKKITKN